MGNRENELDLKNKTATCRLVRADPGAKAMLMIIPLMILGFACPASGGFFRRRLWEGAWITENDMFFYIVVLVVLLILFGAVLFLYYRCINDEREHDMRSAEQIHKVIKEQLDANMKRSRRQIEPSIE